MITYTLIGVLYMFCMMSYLYLVKDETLTYGDLIQACVLLFFWPVLIALQIYVWSLQLDSKVFLKGDKDE